jgi:conjugal transfer pilus assembly protein TraF
MKLFVQMMIILLLSLLPAYSYASSYAKGFYDRHYRGWLWFEEKEKSAIAKKQREALELQQKTKEEYAKARHEVEQFSKELEELKFMMIRYPESIEHVKNYKEKEALMLSSSLKLADTFRMVNFLYPETTNLIDNPINLYGRRIKEEINREETTKMLKDLAGKIELFVFFSSNCPYCNSLESVLNNFAKKYGFKVEAVSLDGSTSKFFKTYQDQELAKRLNLQRTPTIVAVTSDSKIHFELIRGAVSISELEEAGIMAIEYLNKIANLPLE